MARGKEVGMAKIPRLWVRGIMERRQTGREERRKPSWVSVEKEHMGQEEGLQKWCGKERSK